MPVNPDNIRPDGSFDERLFDLTYEKAGRGRWRVIRGLGNPIGHVTRLPNGLWEGERLDGARVTPGFTWQARWVAAHELSFSVSLADDADLVNHLVTKAAS
ncbi:hypothetical protein [Streptomyces sp. NPDC087300]|uniref:hypothetical protein n=1 Tax=Streptomyces sp. NPDC087300 TaxID=3365780 RepID=UPI00382F35CD